METNASSSSSSTASTSRLPLAQLDDKQRRSAAVVYCTILGRFEQCAAKQQLLQRLFDHLNIGVSDREDLWLVAQDVDPQCAVAFVLQVPEAFRWALVFEFLLCAITDGYDARVRKACRLICDQSSVVDWRTDFLSQEARLSALLRSELAAEQDALRNSATSFRWLKVVAAAAVGGLVVGVTGGLAAPAAMAALGLASGAAATTAGVLTVGGIFGVAGTTLTAHSTNLRLRGLREFQFVRVDSVDECVASFVDEPTTDEPTTDDSTAATSSVAAVTAAAATASANPEAIEFNDSNDAMVVWIVVSGFLRDEYSLPRSHPERADRFSKHWLCANDLHGELYRLEWESDVLQALGAAFDHFLHTQAATQGASMVAASLSATIAAISWPLGVLGAATLISNPWSVALDRADKAGVQLAECLRSRAHGQRPVSLVGFSCGARCILRCILELAQHDDSNGILYNVVLIGLPSAVSIVEWGIVRRLVANRVVNVYSPRDWLLSILMKATFSLRSVAGLEPADLDRVENLDVGHLVSKHSEYREKLAEIFDLLKLAEE